MTQEVARPTLPRGITRLTHSISCTRRYPKLKPSQAYAMPCTLYRKQGKRRHTRPGQRGRPICYRSSTLRYHQATSSTSYDARSHPAQSHHAADIQHQLYKAISEAKAFTGLRNALRTIGNKANQDRHIQDNAPVLQEQHAPLPPGNLEHLL
jgi:hypothetical protein